MGRMRLLDFVNCLLTTYIFCWKFDIFRGLFNAFLEFIIQLKWRSQLYIFILYLFNLLFLFPHIFFSAIFALFCFFNSYRFSFRFPFKLRWRFLERNNIFFRYFFGSLGDGFNHLETFVFFKSFFVANGTAFLFFKFSKNTFDGEDFAAITFWKLKMIDWFFCWGIEVPFVKRQRNI